MTTIRTELPIATEPWERARSLFLEQLSPHERTLFEKAELDTIYHDASVSHRKHQQSSKLQAARRRLAPLVDAIDGYGKGLDVMSNTPVAAAFLCPIWGGIRVALYVAQETEKYFEKLAEMLEKIGRALPLFRDYQHLFPSHSRLLQVLSEAYLNVLRFCTDVTALFKEAKTRTVSVVSLTVSCKTLWKPFTLRFAEYLKNFMELKQQVQDEANVAHMIESKRERELQQRNRALVEARSRKDKLRQTLQRFSPIDYHLTHRRLRSECHRGTAQWIFDHDSYKAWIESTESSSIHCTGIPGSGKTILASSVVDNLTADPVDPSHLICFYYCDYADHQTLSPAVMLGTFIRQILEGSTDAEELRTWVLKEWADRTSKPFVEDLLPAVLKAFKQFERVTIVVDALDEFSTLDQRKSGRIIAEFLSLHTCRVKVFLSCRLESIILRELPHPKFSIALSPKLLSEDICRFVEDIVQTKIDRNDLTIHDPAIKQEIHDKLVEGAQDMFLWVKFQIEELCEAMSDIELRETLKNLPRDLAGTYERILFKISSSTHGKKKARLARRAFMWIVCAKRPLTMKELCEAVILDEDDTSFPANRIPTDGGRRLRLACGNLVVFDEEYGSVRLAHHTVQQFMTDRSQFTERFSDHRKPPWFLFSLHEAEVRVYKLCLTYLCFSDFETQITHREGSIPKTFESGGFIHSLINYMLPDTGIAGRLSNVLNGRIGPTSDLSQWSLLIKESARRGNLEEQLKRNYSLLGYVSSWWCYHSPSSSIEKLPLGKTRMLVFEKTFPFPHRPWEDENFAGGSTDPSLQAIFLLRWAARIGSLSILGILGISANRKNTISPNGLKLFHDAILYDNEERDLLAEVLHGGNERILDLYFTMVSLLTENQGKAIPAWILCRTLRLSPTSTHAALFAMLKKQYFKIARGEPEKDSVWRRGSESTLWLDNTWSIATASRFDIGAGTLLLEEAVKQDDIDLVRSILENDVGPVVYFGSISNSEGLQRVEFMSAEEIPLARAAYENNITMVEVLFSYINGTSPLVGARIQDFDIDELYKELEKRELWLMRDHVQALSRSGTGYTGVSSS